MEDQPQYSELSSDELRARLATRLRASSRASRASAFARYIPLPYQREWFENESPIKALVLPNQSGKTEFGAVVTIGACNKQKPVALGGSPTQAIQRGVMAGKKFLAAGSSFQTITQVTILPKLKKYLADGMIERSRRSGGFETTFHFTTGAMLRLMSYEQRPKDFEGGNWDGAWFDEPPPKEVFYAVRRGQMATSGWALITATPLTEPWMLDDLIIPARNADCLECSGGDTPHEEIKKAQPNHGLVYVPDAIEMHDNCKECNGGYLPHEQIETFLASITDDAQRRARQHGIFLNYSALTFGYVNDADNLVEDFDPPVGWPLVEIVDPSPRRGLHIKWYTCDPEDRWYNTHAERIPSDGGFRRMVEQVFKYRQRLGRQPDLCLMDPRGGHHKQVGSDGIQDWFDQFRAHGIVYTPAVAPSIDNARVQTLHDWLKPTYDPSKDAAPTAKLRFCKRLRTMKKGPLWAYERFTWDPTNSPRKQYEQECKDFIDCDTYLALWVNKHNLTFKRWQAQDRPPQSAGIAASYASVPGHQRRSPMQPQRRPPIGRSYRTQPAWLKRIPSNYS